MAEPYFPGQLPSMQGAVRDLEQNALPPGYAEPGPTDTGPVYELGKRIINNMIGDDSIFAKSQAAIDANAGLPFADQLKARLNDPLVSMYGVGTIGNGGGFKPFAGRGSTVLNTLRDEHVAQPDALPLIGSGDVTPPPGIRTSADHDALVQRYVDLAREGEDYRDWYQHSGSSIFSHTGEDPPAADAFSAGLARTSPSTNVSSNATFAIKSHNQAMVGDDIDTGKYPTAMSAAIAKHYYGGEPISGEKIGPFMGAQVEAWNPNFKHQFVNDGWNMTALGYPAEKAGIMWEGKPSVGEHNYARIVADKARAQLETETGMPWSPKQTQAASWTAIKARTQGIPLEEAGRDFSHGLADNYGQISYESAPGLTTNHLPEYHSAPWDQKVEFHNAINDALQDSQGRDIISRHLGLLTGKTVDGPGVFNGVVSPGSQAQVALGQKAGGALMGVDDASRALIDTSSNIRAALLRQDAAAWHKTGYVKDMPLSKGNMIEANLGRPLTPDEALALSGHLETHSGSDFFSPISTPNGFRILNIPDKSGVPNAGMHDIVDAALAHDNMPDAKTRRVFADSNYTPHDWSIDPHGQSYTRAAAGTGRPNLQRRADDLYAALGPRISAVEDYFAHKYGWTPNRDTRFWEQPGQASAGVNDATRTPHWLAESRPVPPSRRALELPPDVQAAFRQRGLHSLIPP
jgi:hypothetical protein